MSQGRLEKICNIVFIVMVIIGLYYAVQVAGSYPLTFDEAYNLQIPQSLAKKGFFAYQTKGWHGLAEFDPWITTGPPVLFVVALWMKVFGNNILFVRMTNIIYWLLFMTAIYVYVKKYNPILAVLSVLLLLSYPMQRAVCVFGEIPSAFFLMVGLSNIGTNLEGNRNKNIFVGIMFGLAVQTKFIMAIFVIALYIFFLYLFVYEHKWKNCVNITIGISIPIIIFEIYRLISLKKLSTYCYNIYGKIATNYKNVGVSFQMSLTDKILKVLDGFGESRLVFGLLLVALFAITIYYIFQLLKNNIKTIDISLLVILLAICGAIVEIIFITDRIWHNRYWVFYYLIPIAIGLYAIVYFNKKYVKKLSYVLIFALSIFMFIQWPWIDIEKNRSELNAQKQMADYIETLGDDIVVYGYGWWENPCISFFYDRQYYHLDYDKFLEINEPVKSRYYLVEKNEPVFESIFEEYDTQLIIEYDQNKLYEIKGMK